MSIVPPSIPHPHAVVMITGVLELVGALGLLFKQLRRAMLRWSALPEGNNCSIRVFIAAACESTTASAPFSPRLGARPLD
jgi:hypothetical protein